MNKRKSILLFLLVSIITLIPSASLAESSFAAKSDPLSRIDYSKAFDQTKLHEEYKDLMIALNCHENIFKNTQTINNHMGYKQIEKAQKEFTKACVNQLEKARFQTIMMPAYENMGILALIAAAAKATSKFAGKESVGGSLGVLDFFMHAAFRMTEIVSSGLNLIYKPTHPLNQFEESFAKNQCFIPKPLWPIIIEKFTLARQNQFEQLKAMNFLEFALGLTIYQQPANTNLKTVTINHTIQELHTRIDQFFAHYNDKSNGEFCRLLKINIAKFVLALAGDTQISPRYIYLHGPGGIGKTHFVRTLAQWIEELMPDTACFNDLIITSTSELEGDQAQPGSMLRVLRNQLMGKKRGSIVFMDEATWLNEGSMVSAAKRVFNGNQAKLSTSYFGSGMDGTGIDLKLPPMLIFVASNAEISDPALASRFDTIDYPMPLQSSLVDHALQMIKNSKVLPATRSVSTEKIENWIQENKINNFRAIESKIEQFMLAKN